MTNTWYRNQSCPWCNGTGNVAEQARSTTTQSFHQCPDCEKAYKSSRKDEPVSNIYKLPPHEWKDIRDVKTFDIVLDGFGNRWNVWYDGTVQVSRAITDYRISLALKVPTADDEIQASISASLTDGETFMVCVEKKQ